MGGVPIKLASNEQLLDDAVYSTIFILARCPNVSRGGTAARYLLQLIVGLSLLKYHKKCHNFIDTPSGKCLCNHGIEDTDHFLFVCPFCAAQRLTLANSVIQFLQKYNLIHLGKQSNPYLYGY